MSIEEIDCEDIPTETILNALQSSSLFSEKKLVIAKNIARNKKLSEDIEQIFTVAKDTNDLIIVEKDADKRSVYYKFIKKTADFTPCEELNEDQMNVWLRSETKNMEARLSAPDAAYLIRRVGLNQQRLHNELQKLVAYDADITRENIDIMTAETPASSVFNLLDAAFSGNPKTALKIYEEQKALGSTPQSILGMFIWQAGIVATAAAGSKISSGELSDATGIKPFSLGKASAIYKKIGLNGVNDLLDRLVQVDKQMKTSSNDPDELLKNLLLTTS